MEYRAISLIGLGEVVPRLGRSVADRLDRAGQIGQGFGNGNQLAWIALHGSFSHDGRTKADSEKDRKTEALECLSMSDLGTILSGTDFPRTSSKMAFSLQFQEPASDSANFLELLLESVGKSDRGAGIFSFASVHGVSLLLADSDFSAFLRRSKFELVVGVDAVTVPAVLQRLSDAQDQYLNFRARAFFHRRAGSLFHPKVCWFANGATGRVFVGSGNLTRGGLLNNWEAIGDADIQGQQLRQFEARWRDWFDRNQEFLCELDDQAVLERARRNEGERRRRHEEDEVEAVDSQTSGAPSGDIVLLAEIPKGSTRWNQANFDLDNFKQFFQLQPGTLRRVVLLPVSPDGTVGDPEVRPSVDVKSHNYRIELGLASGLDYPENGRPIGLFLRIGPRRFRYRLLMPDDAAYGDVQDFLAARWTGSENQMKRIRIGQEELSQALPDLTL